MKNFFNRTIKILPLVAFFFLVDCSRFSDFSKTATIAKVNGVSVPLDTFMLKFNNLKGEQDDITKKNPKVLEKIKTRALNEAIISNLIEQEAVKRNLAIAKEEVEGRLANWKDGYPTGGFEEMLNRQHTTENFLKHRIKEQLLTEKLISELFSSETLVSDEEMKDYHKQHRKDFYHPAKIHAYQIVVPTVQEARKIRQEILSGKITFQSAARKYSLSPDAAKGGDLGFFSKNEKIPAFNKAFRLKILDVSTPIKSRYGIHLLKVVEKQSRRKMTYTEAKDQIAKTLRKLKEARIYNEWLTKLLKEAKIYRNERLFERIS